MSFKNEAQRTFGIEIEMDADRRQVAEALLCSTNGARIESTRLAVGGYRSYTLSGGWVVGFDPSLRKDGTDVDRCTEINTAPFRLSDWDCLASALRSVSAGVPDVGFGPNCGLHVHADASGFDPSRLVRICRIASVSAGAATRARAYYLKPIPGDVLGLVNPSEQHLRDAWFAGYKGGAPAPGHGRLHPARRRIINVGSYWFRGTLEFRWFEATLDPIAVRRAIDEVRSILTESGSEK